MKAKLLFNFFLVCVIGGNAQAPIANFYQPNDWASYTVVTSAVPLAQENSGANRNWDFSQLSEIGNSEVRTSVPTAEELAIYNNSTAAAVTTANVGGETVINKIFSRTVANTVSITGIHSVPIQLIFDIDNATLGAFPMQYGFTNSDGISGTFNAEGGYTGTFTGNSTTAVDAYGTLTVNVGTTPALTPVTRLKMTQTISLDYLFFTNIGTVSLTTYSYYKDGAAMSVPVFRSTHTNINVPMMQIDSTTESLESFEVQLLADSNFQMADFSMLPNPAHDTVTFEVKNQENIRNVKVADVNGRIVMEQSTNEKIINVGELQTGVYFVQIKTDTGTATKKIIKK